tara:strand:- start:24871 stop:26172 length:1302 start_codon:yes stop_codon:yes gene_type:complete
MKKAEHLTYSENFQIVNPEKVTHDSSAYNFSILSPEYNSEKIHNYPEIKKHFVRANINFQIREKKIDRWQFTYTKKDSEGNILYNKKTGLAETLSDEEKKDKIFPRYEYEHAVIDLNDKKVVAKTQNEWGCLLVSVAEEYQGLGIGQELLNYHRNIYPFRYSGGQTPNGQIAFNRCYQEKVSKYLREGKYRRDYLEKKLSLKRIKEILTSAEVGKVNIEKKQELFKHYNIEINTYQKEKQLRKEKYKEKNYDFKNNKELLLKIEDNFAVLYNKRLLNIDFYGKEEYFSEKGMLGYVYLGGVFDSNDDVKLFHVYGDNKKLENFMTEVGFNLFVNENIRVYDYDLDLINSELKHKLKKKKHKDKMTTFLLPKKTLNNLELLSKVESIYRKNKDPYDENFCIIHERLEQKAIEANKNRKKMHLKSKPKNKKKIKI